MKKILIMFLMALSSQSFAFDNVIGPTYVVAEENAISFMQRKAAGSQFDSKENKTKVIRKSMNKIIRPKGTNLPSCARSKDVIISLEQVVERDIILPCGKVLAKKGEKYNPLKLLPNSKKSLVLIDGTKEYDLAYADKLFKENPSVKVVLIRGDIKNTSHNYDFDVYFDQSSNIINKFNVTCTPSIIQRSGENLVLREVSL